MHMHSRTGESHLQDVGHIDDDFGGLLQQALILFQASNSGLQAQQLQPSGLQLGALLILGPYQHSLVGLDTCQSQVGLIV